MRSHHPSAKPSAPSAEEWRLCGPCRNPVRTCGPAWIFVSAGSFRRESSGSVQGRCRCLLRCRQEQSRCKCVPLLAEQLSLLALRSMRWARSILVQAHESCPSLSSRTAVAYDTHPFPWPNRIRCLPLQSRSEIWVNARPLYQVFQRDIRATTIHS